MKNFIFLLAAFTIIAVDANAQKGIDAGTQYGSGEDSVRCITNMNLFIPHARSKNFEEAYPFWKATYDECPASTVNIYIYGTSIILWQFANETDPAKKEELVNEMIKLYDDRIKYYGASPRNRSEWKDVLIFRKTQHYYQMKGENSDHQLAYKWLGDVIEEYKDKSYPNAVMYYMVASYNLLQANMDGFKEQYVNDFLKCSAILDVQLAAAEAENNEKDKEDIFSCKKEIESNLAASGAADCAVLQNIYGPRVEESKDNIEALKEILLMLRRLGCNETDAFLAASEYAYKIEPSADAAAGLGTKALKSNDVAAAKKYLNEAIEMYDDPDSKAKIYLLLISIANEEKQFSTVKQLCQRCLAENPNMGQAYMFWASAYAQGGRNLYPDDPILNKLVWYAVVDKFERARQVDPSLSAEANRQINIYNKHFPSTEDIFMHPLLKEGDNFTLPAWVNEVVRIR